MPVETHKVKFYRDLRTNLHKAVCSCGWVAFGDQARVQEVAATHDLDWQEIAPLDIPALFRAEPPR